MSRHAAQLADVDARIDEVLGTLPLVRANEHLSRLLDAQLAGLLLERALRGMRDDLHAGRMHPMAFADELRSLADQCRHVGIDAPVL